MNFRKSILIFFISLLYSIFNFAIAQSYDTAKYKTGEIKIFSNRIITNKFDSPVKVQFINSEEIYNKNGEALSDALQLGGNVFIKSYGGNYSLNTISINGLGAEHTLILLNGFKINSFQNNQLDLNTITKDNIERIEILNNGSSSIYGPEAIGGVVNIITKKNLAKNLKVNLNGQIGSYEQKKIYFEVEKNVKNFNIDLSYAKESSLNNYGYYFNNGIEKLFKERANSDYDFSNYSLNINYSNGKDSRINILSNYSNQFRNIPGIETGSEPSNTTQLDRNWNNILSYENNLSKSFSVKSQINFQNNLSNYINQPVTNSFYKNIVISNAAQINYVKNKFELAAGYEINYATLKSDELEDNIRRIQPAIFLVSEIKLNKMIRVFPSLRYDYISDIKNNALSAKLGINFKPFKDYKLNLKASAGNNFASPTFNELYWKELGNKNLKPESSVNIDAGAIFNFKLFFENTIEATYTYINAKDKIIWSPNANGLWGPKNIGRSTSNILLVEANFIKELSKAFKIKFDFNYSFIQSLKKSEDYRDDPSYNKQIFYVPEQLAKCNLSLNYKRSGLNLFYTFTGKRFTNFENTNYLPAMDLFEGNIYQSFTINKINTQLKLEVNNIFNTDYQIISGYPMPLRNYKLILSLEY